MRFLVCFRVLKMRLYAPLGCQKADVASTQACSFKCYTALGLSFVPPVTLIKELSPVIPGGTDVVSQCTEQPSTVSEAIPNITYDIPPMYRRTFTIGAENSILLAYSRSICSHLSRNKSILSRNKAILLRNKSIFCSIKYS